MFSSSRSLPVGILVSVSGPSRRRKPRSLADYPPIKKEGSLPIYIGVNAALSLAILLVVGLVYAVQTANSAPAKGNLADPPRQLAQPALAPPFAGQPAARPAVAPAEAPPLPPWGGWESLFTLMSREIPKPPRAAPPPPVAVAPPAAPPVCSNLGTEVTFFHHPPDAFRQAAKENKLVLMVHLSGNFEDQAFT